MHRIDCILLGSFFTLKIEIFFALAEESNSHAEIIRLYGDHPLLKPSAGSVVPTDRQAKLPELTNRQVTWADLKKDERERKKHYAVFLFFFFFSSFLYGV